MGFPALFWLPGNPELSLYSAFSDPPPPTGPPLCSSLCLCGFRGLSCPSGLEPVLTWKHTSRHESLENTVKVNTGAALVQAIVHVAGRGQGEAGCFKMTVDMKVRVPSPTALRCLNTRGTGCEGSIALGKVSKYT